MKRHLGITLMRWGAKLFFTEDASVRRFKTCVNAETYVNGYAETGGHILADVKPMCDYNTQSIINVLTHGYLEIPPKSYSKKEFYYRENWIG